MITFRLKTYNFIKTGGFLFALLFFSNVHAYDFMDRSRGVRLYYNILSDQERTVEVTHGEDWEPYEGNYTIPRSVRHNGKRYRVVAIGKRAFAGCGEVRNVTFNSNITRIDSAAFCRCTALTRLRLPERLKYVGDYAFAYCGFPYVNIPAAVNHIGKGAFSYCQYVVDILVDDKNAKFTDSNGSSCIVDQNTMTLVQGCSGTIVPDRVKRIADEAFAGCVDLYEIKLPKSVVEIGNDAFRESGLHAFVFPDGVTDLSDRLFYNCENLQEITFPLTMISLGTKAFYGCHALKTITMKNYDPLPINNDAFPPDVYGKATLVVPIGADDLYKIAPGWKQFRKVIY